MEFTDLTLVEWIELCGLFAIFFLCIYIAIELLWWIWGVEATTDVFESQSPKLKILPTRESRDNRKEQMFRNIVETPGVASYIAGKDVNCGDMVSVDANGRLKKYNSSI